MMRKTFIVFALAAFGCTASQPVPGGSIAPHAGDDYRPLTPQQLYQDPSSSPTFVMQKSKWPVLDLRLVFAVGSAADPPNLRGLTAVTARMMAEGARGDHSYAQVRRLLYPMAATFDVHVDRDQTVFAVRVHRDHVRDLLPLLGDTLLLPAFTGADLKRVKAQLISELVNDLRGSNDEQLVRELLQSMLYEGHPYGHPALGYHADLKAIHTDAVRKHYADVFCAQRLTIGIAGDYPPWLAPELRDRLLRTPAFSCDQPQSSLPQVAKRATPRAWIVEKPDAQAIPIALGIRIEASRNHPDHAALTLAASYLGQHRQFIGVLMQKIREQRGLNYGDYAYAEHFVQAGWTRFARPNVARRQQYFSLWLRPMEPNQAVFGLKLAVRELEKLVQRGLSETEFRRIRSYALKYFSLSLQTADQALGSAIDDRFYDLSQPYIQGLKQAWRKMTVAQFNAAVARHLRLQDLQIATFAPNAAAFKARLLDDAPTAISYKAETPDFVRREDVSISAYRLPLQPANVFTLTGDQVFE